MGRYPQALLDFFNAYIKDFLLFSVLLIGGIFLISKVLNILKKLTVSGELSKTQNTVFKITAATLYFGVTFTLLMLVYPETGIISLVLLSTILSFLLTFKLEIANRAVWHFWLGKQGISLSDYVRIGEHVGVVRKLNADQLVLETSKCSVSIPLIDLPGSYIQNLSEHALEKSTLKFQASDSFDLEDFYDNVQKSISATISVVKLEFPVSSQSEAGQEVSINIWSYSEFSWEIYNQVFPQIQKMALSSDKNYKPFQVKSGKA